MRKRRMDADASYRPRGKHCIKRLHVYLEAFFRTSPSYLNNSIHGYCIRCLRETAAQFIYKYWNALRMKVAGEHPQWLSKNVPYF